MISEKVSIVLPVYNAVSTIEAAIQSCVIQTYHPIELILIDDGSTDGSSEIMKQLAIQDERIRLFRTENKGVAEAMNWGMRMAQGKYIARMDADDLMLPQRIEKQVEFLEQNQEIGLVSCLVKHGGNQHIQEGYARHVEWLNTLISPKEISLNRFIDSPVCNPSVMFRSHLVEKHGDCRQGNFPEDYEIWLRWMDQGVQMAKIPELLFIWNDLPSRLTRNDERYSAEAFERAKTGYLAEFITEQNRKRTRPVYLCGAGKITRRKSDFLVASGLEVGGYIDVDPKKIGKVYNGYRVIGLDDLPSKEQAYVVSYVANRGAREEIRKILLNGNLEEGKDFILAG
jgi:glycosyltransferase involved in cell wall biosynthesis